MAVKDYPLSLSLINLSKSEGGGGEANNQLSKLCKAGDAPEGITVQYNGKIFGGGQHFPPYSWDMDSMQHLISLPKGIFI